MLDLPLTSIATDIETEKSAREQDSKKLLTYGIDFLDKTLVGIIPSDLILIGAKSGIGKTEFAMHMAQINAHAGFHVAYLALEAEKHEVARRLKFREISRLYYEDHTKTFTAPINYRLYRFNKLDKRFKCYEEQAERNLKVGLSNMSVYYREESFDIGHLSKFLQNIKNDIDILIIDHLHYFDTYDENDCKSMSNIMKRIRDLNQIYNIPTVLLAHLRKNGLNYIPDLEDFMGTSDIGKIATTAIMIAPDYDNQDYKNGAHGTYLRIVKSRLGNVSRLVGYVNFDSKQCRYSSMHKLLKINKSGDSCTEIKVYDYPYWLEETEDEKIPF